MYDGLLLNGVDVTSDDSAVIQKIELSSHDASDATESNLPFAYLAASGARGTLDPSAGKLAEQLCTLSGRHSDFRPKVGHVTIGLFHAFILCGKIVGTGEGSSGVNDPKNQVER
jgi:hypothetical protein